MSKPELLACQAKVVAAREEFMSTLHQIQQRLSPKAIADDVKGKALAKADGALNAARDGIAQAANHPSTVAAITVPLLLYCLRKPIGKAISSLNRGRVEEPARQPYEAARDPAPLPINAIRAHARTIAKQGA